MAMNNCTDCDNRVDNTCCHESIRYTEVAGVPNDDFNSVEFDRFKNSVIAEEREFAHVEMMQRQRE